MTLLICWLSPLVLGQKTKQKQLQVSTSSHIFITLPSFLEHSTSASVTNVPHFDMATPTAKKNPGSSSTRLHPRWKTHYQSNVKSTPSSCRLIIQPNPPRCRCYGWGWPALCYYNKHILFFFHPPSHLLIFSRSVFKDWAFFFWKRIIKQLSANWQKERLLKRTSDGEKKLQSVSTREKQTLGCEHMPAHTVCTHTQCGILRAFTHSGAIPSLTTLLCFHCWIFHSSFPARRRLMLPHNVNATSPWLIWES